MASKTTTTVNACTLLCKYKPRLELPEFSAEAIESAMQKMKLWQWVVPRLRHVPQKTNRTGHILDWKTNEPQSMSRNISDHSFLSHNFCIFIYVSLLQILVRQIHANHTSKRVWYIIAPNFYIFFYIFYIYKCTTSLHTNWGLLCVYIWIIISKISHTYMYIKLKELTVPVRPVDNWNTKITQHVLKTWSAASPL